MYDDAMDDAEPARTGVYNRTETIVRGTTLTQPVMTRVREQLDARQKEKKAA